MANAVLFYTGNVCSTPMVEYARLTHEVFVPVYEHFDSYFMTGKGGIKEQVAPNMLDATLRALYQRTSSPYLDSPKVANYRRGASIPTAGERPHIFFKWRPFGESSDKAEAIRETFAANEVVPALMLRRSIAQQALKIRLSEIHYSDRHVQHRTERMSDADYAAFGADQQKVRIELDDSDVVAIRTIARNSLAQTRKTLEAAEFFFLQVRPIKAVVCEDIFDPGIDHDAYRRTMERLLGAPISFGERLHPRVRKAGLNPEHCVNPELALEDEKVSELESRYLELLSGLDRISAAAGGAAGVGR